MKGIIGKDVESQWENELMIEDDGQNASSNLWALEKMGVNRI